MSYFGDYYYGKNLFGGGTLPTIPGATAGAFIEIYDQNGDFKGGYQTGVGDFMGCEFTLDVSGCRDFILHFATKQSIVKRDRIKIKLFNAEDYFFSGVVRKIPIDGSTETAYQYTGYGFNDYLIRINTESKTYANKTVDYIINDLLDTVITIKTPITKNGAKLSFPAITLTSAVFAYVNMQDAIDALKKIATSTGDEYITGVDTDGDFFFRPRETDIKKVLVVGARGVNGIDSYAPTEEEEPRTKYFLFTKAGVYISTITNTADFEIFEEKLVAPDIDNTTAERWAEGILTESQASTRRATIQWKIEEDEPLLLIADGTIRVVCNIPPIDLMLTGLAYGEGDYGEDLYGGEAYDGKDIDDTLKVVQVKYSLMPGSIMRDIELGSLPIRLDDQVLGIRKNLVDLRISLGR